MACGTRWKISNRQLALQVQFVESNMKKVEVSILDKRRGLELVDQCLAVKGKEGEAKAAS